MSKQQGITFRNCSFRFKCTESWEGLTKTEKASIRYCRQCDRGVHLCQSEAELVAAIQANHCVAIPRELMPQEDEPVEIPHLLGDIAAPYGLDDAQ